jgi:hypothetical protein
VGSPDARVHGQASDEDPSGVVRKAAERTDICNDSPTVVVLEKNDIVLVCATRHG